MSVRESKTNSINRSGTAVVDNSDITQGNYTISADANLHWVQHDNIFVVSGSLAVTTMASTGNSNILLAFSGMDFLDGYTVVGVKGDASSNESTGSDGFVDHDAGPTNMRVWFNSPQGGSSRAVWWVCTIQVS